ncbi:MAG: terminase large subunit [Alphaproteobacteria bacterium]|nr:MAG: terminase large subunit [Alphaproteobacteria bacterium]PZO36595.1 MAG: terminase large subunit [Alphaproteobacteria bacterium]
MGLRGPGARPIKAPQAEIIGLFSHLEPVQTVQTQPWEVEGLSRVERVVAFLESLPITSGVLAGDTFEVRPWQRKFLDAVYGLDEMDGRPVRTAVLSMARKNGKSGIAAGLALCHLCGPEAEARGQVYSAANDRNQAALLYAEMAAIIDRTPWMEERLSLRRHAKEIEDLGGTGSVYAALSADVGTKHGLSPSFVVYDELGQAPKRDLFDALDTAMGARAEPLMLVISTQAPDDLAPLSELIDYGLRIQHGEIEDPSFHLTLFAAPADADPWDEATWYLANPALGDFRSKEDVARQASQAKRIPSKEAAFRNLILNQRVAAETRFLPISEWQACGGDLDEDQLLGRPCWAGLDLAATRDLTALVLVFPDDDGNVTIRCHFYLPSDGLADRAERDRVPYTVWRDQGRLTTTPGATTDPRFVAAEVARIASRYQLQALAYDRWRIETFKVALAEEGLSELELIPHGQGFKDMAPAIDMLEHAVAERRLLHGMNPILTWCIGNAVITADPAGNRKLDKSRSNGRIDGAVALAMALHAMQMKPEEAPWSPMIEFG